MPLVDLNALNSAVGDINLYNGLDALATSEILTNLIELEPQSGPIYRFERALQAPAMEMMLRGFKIDRNAHERQILRLEAELKRLDDIIQQIARAIWGKPLNPNSRDQLMDFFYNHIGIEPIITSVKGQAKRQMNHDVLERIGNYFNARLIVNAILAYRDRAKSLSVLTSDIDSDWRIRTSYNIAKTTTGRFSSSKSLLGTGLNQQNITESLRHIFIADEGKVLCGIDLEQAESREVGWLCWILFGDDKYLNACEAGDLHTTVSRMIWPELGWTSDTKQDRKIAERPYYRHMSYRDLSKRAGHGSNYRLAPRSMATHLKIPVKMAVDFQDRYFSAFKGIHKYHHWIAAELQRKQRLTTVFGRTRDFFGRPKDDDVIRSAIAFMPQSATADRLNLAMLRIWRYMPEVQLLSQLHDAVYFQFDENLDHNLIINKALNLINIPLTYNNRTFTVPGEAKIGRNWGNYHPEKNPNGLRKVKL